MFYCLAYLATYSLGIHNPFRYSEICQNVTEFVRKMPHENSVVNVSGVGCSVYSASVFQIPDINLNASGFYSFTTY